MARLSAAVFAAATVLLLAGCGGGAEPAQIDVSRAPGAQFETRIAVDPSNPDVLVAASMGQGSPSARMYFYSSTDGGPTWRSFALPIPGNCAWDPAVAIDASGRQYVAFARLVRCDEAEGSAAIFLASRSGPSGRWKLSPGPVRRIQAPRFDDRPALAADGARVYLAWVDYRNPSLPIRLIRSDDVGERKPVEVNETGWSTGLTLAVGRGGALYAGWEDPLAATIMLARSGDGGRRFASPITVARVDETDGGRCGSSIPAQGLHQNGAGCVRPVPTVTADRTRGRVYVTWAGAGDDRTQDVYAASYDAGLRPLLRPRRVTAERGDQFMPASAVDPSSGTLWVCFYDTSGDPSRVRTQYSCTWSADGGESFHGVVRAASSPSNERRPGAAFYGDYTGLAVAGGVAHPIWTDSRDFARLREEIYTTRLEAR